MDGKGETPPPPEEGLARDRCPSCGGKLAYEPGRDQGFCAIEGIYVEVLVPPPEAERPPLVREAVLHATKRDLQRLCKAYGQRTSGNKTDLLTRLLRYMDEHGIDLPPEEIAEAAVAAPEPGAGAPEGEPAKPSEEAKPPAPGPPPLHGPDVDTLLAEVEHLAAQPTAPPPPPEEVPPKPAKEPPPEERPTKPEPLFVEAASAAEPAPGEEAFLLEAAGMAHVGEPTAEEAAMVPVAAVAPAVDAARLRRDRIAFYVGTLLVAAGGPGLIFGSILHDAFRVPLFGDTYEAFGPLNMAAALIGGVVLAGGLVAMGVGLRGGIVRAKPAQEG